MEEKSTLTLNFIVCPSKARKNGLAPINIVITANGRRASLSTHKFIKPSDWDATRQRVRGGSEEAKAINDYLFQARTQLVKKETALLERGYIVTAEALKEAFQERIPTLM